MPSELYTQFFRRCLRYLALGTALSIVPAGAFYFFTFDYTRWQLAMLCVLGITDLAIFFPLDVLILRWSLAPVRRACVEAVDPPPPFFSGTKNHGVVPASPPRHLPDSVPAT